MATGAVLAGRHTFEPAGGWGGDHHDGVPIFIVSRHEPTPPSPTGPSSPTSTTSRRRSPAPRMRPATRTCWSTARASRGSPSPPGSSTSSRSTSIPILLGGGQRLFDESDLGPVELEQTEVIEGADATHLRYRVRR